MDFFAVLLYFLNIIRNSLYSNRNLYQAHISRFIFLSTKCKLYIYCAYGINLYTTYTIHLMDFPRNLRDFQFLTFFKLKFYNLVSRCKCRTLFMVISISHRTVKNEEFAWIFGYVDAIKFRKNAVASAVLKYLFYKFY